MKKLCSSLFSPPIDISDPRFIVLVAENRKTLYEIGYYCFLGFEGGSRYLYAVDSQSGKEAPMEYIENLFDLDPNTKKNVNMLYRIVKSTYTDSLADSIETITSSIQKVLKEISMDFEIPLTSDEIIKAEDIFKMANLRFSENEECFRDRLLKYILITHELQKSDCFVCFGLKQYLPDEELSDLIREIAYRRITLVDIEPFDYPKSVPDEIKIIIDKDLCSIE